MQNSTIQPISDISDPNSKNDIVIGLEQRARAMKSSMPGKQTILDILQKTIGGGDSGKPDFNSASPADLAAYLTQKDPLRLERTPAIATTSSRSGSLMRATQITAAS